MFITSRPFHVHVDLVLAFSPEISPSTAIQAIRSIYNPANVIVCLFVCLLVAAAVVIVWNIFSVFRVSSICCLFPLKRCAFLFVSLCFVD